jgi:outer membrane receptor protein involved in Fe transport
MRTFASGLLACFFAFSACLSAAQLKGKVTDPSGAPISGAQVSISGRTGVSAQTVTSESGVFQLEMPDLPDLKVTVTAPGFAAQSIAPTQAASVKLQIAPQAESVQVVGSAIDAPLSEQGGSVSVITSAEIRERNEPFAFDLLRYTPGVTFNQGGAAGAVGSLFLRGGNSNFALVQIDGIPVNSFGGSFDFAHIPAQSVQQVEIARGAQSAIYGSYANTGVIDFETRRAGSSASLDLVAEGGTFRERRFGVSAAGTAAGFGLSLSASRFDTDGPVVNSDYRNEGVTMNVSRYFGRQSLFLHGDFNSNEVGEPGPWGSNPKHIFSGIDTISRAKNNFGDYGARYSIDVTSRVREELIGSFFLYNNGYRSPFGFSYNKDLRGLGESRTIVSVTPHYTLAFGVAGGHEEVKNTYITDNSFSSFPIPRNNFAAYVENRFVVGSRLFLNAGVRGEWISTEAIPTDGFSRPAFPANRIAKANPKISLAYVAGSATRLHASFGTGLRPPSGFELAFTTNPALKPERTRSFDAGIERRIGPVSLDATYFYNRYYDLIITLGGSLSTLSHFTSDNLANSRAQGAEFSARVRPARWMLLTGSYTLLKTEILAVPPRPFVTGQPLTRRPDNTGSAVAMFTRGRVSADVTGYFRGKALYEEPSYGASNGLFWNPGFANVGVNLNIALGHGVTAYGHLRNALNRQYEEVFGFPSPKLNFVAGMKWSIRARE